MGKKFLSVKFCGEQEFIWARKFLTAYLEELLAGSSEREKMWVEVAVNEALNNAHRHAGTVGEALTNEPVICVQMYVYKGRELRIKISDSGRGFDGQARITKSVDDSFGEEDCDKLWCESGRGIELLRFGVDQVKYNRKGNAVTLIKSLVS
jgi:anti-sigma regulatory factor (Ser/Thr protein kinase)